MLLPGLEARCTPLVPASPCHDDIGCRMRASGRYLKTGEVVQHLLSVKASSLSAQGM